MSGRVLVAGIGNIFLRDDGFGVEVARRLSGVRLPDGVRVADYGTSGMHLAYDMAGGYGTTILVDAAPRGDPPGTVTVVEVDGAQRRELAARRAGHGTAEPPAAGAVRTSMLFDAHGMQPDVVFGVLDMLGVEAGRVLVVGCEPACVDEGMGLTEPVAAAVDDAVRVVTGLVAEAVTATTTADAAATGAADRAATGDVGAH